ncbi:hypothetical protein NJC10_03610 [Micrococcus sp. M4NT]|uniref:hypothetical protein n=1 Tax=Micrococcus sp. M4NT TaxID=2957501 RepID=UPI0029BB83F7|nr:hypothetical protein [Micrococcus sp. M4NT]MDX2340766.1 hypothetical protein [Micrococcus sp. M4NT]
MDLIDPEIVIPRVGAEKCNIFWARMMLYSTGKAAVGPATQHRLNKLLSNPNLFEHPQLAHDILTEIYRWISVSSPLKIDMSTVAGQDQGRVHGHHPHYGAEDSAELLGQDLHYTAGPVIKLIHADPLSWSVRQIPSNGVGLVFDESPCATGDFSRVSVARALVSAGSKIDIHALSQISSELFPRIVFHGSCWSRVTDITVTWEQLLPKLIRHLSVLNDFGVEIFNNYSVASDRSARLGSLGVEASAESPNTRKNRKAWAQRLFNFPNDGGDQRCEWHTKIEPTRGRVHFKVLDDKVLVGAIVEHLDT